MSPVAPHLFSSGLFEATSRACVHAWHGHFASAVWWGQQQEAAAGALRSGRANVFRVKSQTPVIARARHHRVVRARSSGPGPTMGGVYPADDAAVKGPASHEAARIRVAMFPAEDR